MGTNSRLTREYKKIASVGGFVSDNILVKPNPSNILEWHYLLFDLEGSPFEGGLYHGKLKFPKEYPFAPPSILMLTPSGRFTVNQRLCFSMSDYHPETWNPLWTVETLLIGFASFMLDDSRTTGSIDSSVREKQRLARSSYNSVQKERLMREMFPVVFDKGIYSEEHQYFTFKAKNAEK